VVGLARARDRLLERLYHHGLSVDLDVPAFLRFARPDSGDRLPAVRDWLARAREPVHRWVAAARPPRPGDGPAPLSTQYSVPGAAPADAALQPLGLGAPPTRFTRAYADLVLAWGLARLGERAGSHDLLTQARAVLAGPDPVHAFLLEAYAYRARQALDGRAGQGSLPPELLARLEAMDAMTQYKAARLLGYSRILDPEDKRNAFRDAALATVVDDFEKTLRAARALADRAEKARRFGQLLAEARRTPDREPRVLEAALSVAPSVGEDFAGAVVDRLVQVADTFAFDFAARPSPAGDEVGAVERGLFVAAHFDRADAVPRLLAGFDRLLAARRRAAADEDALLGLVGQGLRGLRKLGLRAEADRLLTRLTDWLMPVPDLGAVRRRNANAWPAALRRLLHLAGGWFYVGRDGPAAEVLDEARAVLFGATPDADERTNLAVAYVDALGQAPARLALGRVEEVFQRLQGVADTKFTASHYSLAQLRVIEAVVLAVVNDDFALGPAARRWLDDDEYLVRRRIHRDVRALVG
jgi:hypothetical protein